MPRTVKNFFSKIGDKMNSILSDKPNSVSSSRVVFLCTATLSNIAIFFIWIFMCIKSGTMIDIPEGVIWLYAAANGVSFTGKVAQKFAEGKTKTSTSLEEEHEPENEDEEFELAKKEILKRETAVVKRGRPAATKGA